MKRFNLFSVIYNWMRGRIDIFNFINENVALFMEFSQCHNGNRSAVDDK